MKIREWWDERFPAKGKRSPQATTGVFLIAISTCAILIRLGLGNRENIIFGYAWLAIGALNLLLSKPAPKAAIEPRKADR